MTTRLCNIPAGTLPPCDLEWGHDGDMHCNLGDGFYAARHLEEHHRRQRIRALTPPLDRGAHLICWGCKKPDDNLMLLVPRGGDVNLTWPGCSACYLARPDLQEAFEQLELPSELNVEHLSEVNEEFLRRWMKIGASSDEVPSNEVPSDEVHMKDETPDLAQP